MLLLPVLARVKKPHDFTAFLAHSSNIWPLERIAVQAGVGQICQSSRPTMFFSDNMIDLERERRKGIRQVAVLADAMSPRADLLLHGARDCHCVSRSETFEYRARLGMQQVQKMSYQEVAVKLMLFSFAQGTLAILLC